jgi:uncharacterized phiE125 gp8 family phage protein
MAVRWETKRPNEVRDYRHDWSLFLDGDTIVTSDVTVTGVTLNSETNDADSITVWLSGGTDGGLATITNTITTTGGRTETEVFTLCIRAVGEPVSLAVAKAHLRVTDESEDALIISYISAARQWVENYTGHILVRRPMTQTFSEFWPYLELYYRPIVSITNIAYTDADGAAQTILPVDLLVTADGYPYRIRPADAWPTILTYSPVTVSFTAGYNEGSEPQSLIHAMLLLIGHYHTNRAAVGQTGAGVVSREVPLAVVSLCDQYRVPVV